MTSMTRRRFVKGAALAPITYSSFRLDSQTSASSDRFDIVVAGAGHNSRIAAAYLAKAGFRCVVLEGGRWSVGTSRPRN